MSDKPSEPTENDTFSPLAKRFLWADSPAAVERVIFWLSILCGLLFVLDLIIHRHAYAPGEGIPGFYAVVGFGAFTIIVLGATQLRRFILRNENYYSPYSVDAEDYPEDGLEKLVHGEQLNQHASKDHHSKDGSVIDRSGEKIPDKGHSEKNSSTKDTGKGQST